MAGESQETPSHAPDPSVMTTEQLDRAVKAERDYVQAQLDVIRQRLNGIDKATEVLSETITRTPTDIQKEVSHLRELLEEKMAGVDKQFKERDTRQERESRDNKLAVDAAFAAQEKQSLAQNTSNAQAREKSEKSTADLLLALSEKVDDVKDRVGRVESIRAGGKEQLTGIYAAMGALAVLLSIGITIVVFVTTGGR